MHAKAAIVAGVAVAVLGGGGLALAQGEKGAAPSGGTTQAADVRPAATISRAEAERIALAKAGGGLVRETELESEEGALVWKIRVIARGVEHDIYIDTRSGTVVRHQVGNDRRDGTPQADDDLGRDGVRHDAGDDHGGLRRHDAGDDHGGLRGDDRRGGDDGGRRGGDDGGHHGEG